MKKIIIALFICLYNFYSLFSFDIGQKFKTATPRYFIKIDDEVGFCLNGAYEIKDINTFKSGKDGWYKVSFCGEDLYVVFGSIFFIYYRENGKKDSFLRVDNFDEYIKKNFYWGHPVSIKSDDDYFWAITRYIKSIDVPDVLEETSNGKKIVYDTYDMLHYYINETETECKYYRYNAKPWATSKNPQGMKIRMNLTEPKDKIVILNGYVHPGKRHLYKANRRLKTVKVTSPEAKFEVIESIEDVVHFHEIGLPVAVCTVDIEILDCYEGEKYKDLCVQMFGLRDYYDDYYGGNKYLDKNSFKIYRDCGYKPWGKEYKEQ